MIPRGGPPARYLAATWLATTLRALCVHAQTQTPTPTPSLTTSSRMRTDTTVYVVPATYTAPASCPTPFTVETLKTVYVPSTERSTISATRTERNYLLPYIVTAYLAPGAVTDVPSTTDFDYRFYVSYCTNPTATSTSTPTSASTSIYDDTEVCVRRYACLPLRTFIVVIASVLPTLFVLGFAESFLWFRRLMHGHAALRTGTFCWILMSLWVLCFTRTTPARAPTDRPALRAQWAALSAAQKWRLWWRWGFRHKYPVELLGPDPRYPRVEEAPKEGVVPGAARTEA